MAGGKERVMVDKGCGNCYYDWFDERAYPCSLCIRGVERTDMWKAKIFATGLSKESDKPVPNYTTASASTGEPQTETSTNAEKVQSK